MQEAKPKKENHFSLFAKDSVKLLTGNNRKKRDDQLLLASFEGVQQLTLSNPKKKVSAKDEEEWHIKSLPSDWQPNLKPSKAIERLREKKRKRHEEAIAEMEAKFSLVNARTEEKIRQVTVIYKEALVKRNGASEEILRPIRVERRGKLQFTQEYFDELIDKVFEVNWAAETKLREMMDDIMDLEKKRTNEFKAILKDACAKLNAISYQLPFELQEYFEKRIQGINEITMGNVRCYAELKTHLRLHLKNELRLQLQEIQSAQENWTDIMKSSALQELNETKLLNIDCSQVLLQNETFKDGAEQLMVKSDELKELQAKITRPHGIPLDAICEWLQKIDAIAFDLDGFAKEMLLNFEQSVANLFQLYFTDVNKLAEKIGALTSCTDLYGPPLLRTATKYNLQLENIQKSWGTAQSELLRHVRDTFVFLHTAVDVRKNHQSRLRDIETLVLKDLRKVQKQNEILPEETKLNVAVDVLRQESELENLAASLRQVQIVLADVEKVYTSNYEKEGKLLEKASDLVELETSVLLADLGQFLSVYSEFAPADVADEEPAIANGKEVEEEEGGLLSSQIQMCYTQVEKLCTWRSQLYEAIHRYFESCRAQNLEWANAFIQCQKKDLDIILSNKISLLCATKYDRVKATIHDVRLAEIKKHRDRFEKHEAGIQEQVEKISAIFPKHAPKYDALLSGYNEEVTNIAIKITTTGSLEIIKKERASLNSFTENCKKKLEVVDQEYQREYLVETNRISLANHDYLKALLMFSDGGNFGPQEAKAACEEIGRLEKAAKKKVLSANKVSGFKFERHCQEVEVKHEKLLTMMNQHVDELEFRNKYKATLKDVQAALIRETFGIKFKRKQLAALVADAKKMQERHLGVPSCVEIVIDSFKKVIESFREFFSVICRPETKNYANYVMKDFLETSNVGSKKSKLSSDVSSVCKSLLFDVKPEVASNFISRTQDLIYSSFERVRSLGAEFYATRVGTQFQRKELLHTNLEEYIVEMLPKHIYFYLQCEIVWLKEARDFIEMARRLSRYLGEYHERFVSEYVSICMRGLRQVFGDVSTEVEAQSLKTKTEFFKIHRKLKALHGYPGNKSLLDDLTQEINDFFQSKVEEGGEPYFRDVATDLENERELFREKVVELDVRLGEVRRSFTDKHLSENIAIQYEITVNYLKSIVALKHPGVVENENVKMRVLQQLDVLKTNLPLPFEDVVRSDDLDVRGGDSILSCNEELSSLIQKYDEEMQVIFAEVDGIKEKGHEVLQQWKNMWTLDKEKIVELYGVKYNSPNL